MVGYAGKEVAELASEPVVEAGISHSRTAKVIEEIDFDSEVYHMGDGECW